MRRALVAIELCRDYERAAVRAETRRAGRKQTSVRAQRIWSIPQSPADYRSNVRPRQRKRGAGAHSVLRAVSAEIAFGIVPLMPGNPEMTLQTRGG
jgi:hypothetical protein